MIQTSIRYKSKSRIAVCFFAWVMLISCSQPNAVPISHDANITLLSPKKFGHQLAITQKVTFSFKNKDYHMLTQIEIDHKAITIVGFSPIGNLLFSLIYSDDQLTTDLKHNGQHPIDARFILADFQLIYLPIATLKPHLSPASSKVTEKIYPKYGRIVYSNNKPIIDISFKDQSGWRGRVEFNHLERNYQIRIETLSVEAL